MKQRKTPQRIPLSPPHPGKPSEQAQKAAEACREKMKDSLRAAQVGLGRGERKYNSY